MKFIHCADIHLGAPQSSLPSAKANVLKEEHINTFENLCEFAKQNEVTAVIIAGDFFDEQKISNKLKTRIFNCIAQCPNIDFLYLNGNHDDILLDANIVPSNLKLFNNVWSGFRYSNVFIQGIAFDGTNSSLVYNGFSASEYDVNIVVMHGQVANYKNQEKAEIISIPNLKGKNIDYLALGHYHSYAYNKLDDRGEYVYSGCLQGRGFDECGQKGFVLIEVNNKELTHKFIPFAPRELFEVNYEIKNPNDWYAERLDILNFLSGNYPKNSLIKLILKGGVSDKVFIDKTELEQALNTSFFYAKVYDKTVILINEKSFKNDKSIKGEFVNLVLTSDLDEQTKSKIIKCGLNAIKGEELL